MGIKCHYRRLYDRHEMEKVVYLTQVSAVVCICRLLQNKGCYCVMVTLVVVILCSDESGVGDIERQR